MKVYIVAFAPSENSPNGVGGFDWYVARADARKRMLEHLGEAEGYDLAYIEAHAPDFEVGSFQADAVTAWIEQNVALP